MGSRDPRVDAYIANSAEFAQPILLHIRELVHATCPDAQETMKWSFPHFDYKGMMCSMASFKAHCAFGFWKGALVLDGPGDRDAMGHFGRIASVKELPNKRTMTGYIRKAMQLNDDGIKAEKAPKAKKSTKVIVPADLAAAMGKNRKALATFESFSPSQRREYVEWITEAKREDTRLRRVEQAVEMLAEGKTRNWKYQAS